MIVGIDLGTSTSEIAVVLNGKPDLIRDVAYSNRGILPSIVGVDRNTGSLRVGLAADSSMDRGFGVQEVKRQMGRPDRILLGGEAYLPQEISAILLRHLKEQAEKYLAARVSEAVVTVPAYFSDIQRQATHDAAELAGLRVRRLINEPTAAAVAYGLNRQGAEERIAVYDLGGGTLDVTILELSEGILDVLASVGNPELGGKDFDELLMAHLAAECRRQTGVDLQGNPSLRAKLKRESKAVKEALSTDHVARVELELPHSQVGYFEYDVSRAEFNDLIRVRLHSTRMQLDEALAAKGMAPGDIDALLLVGGSTRIPLVREFVGDYFGGRPILGGVSPDEAVVLGAAVVAALEERTLPTGSVVITDVSPFTLGVAVTTEVDDVPVQDVFDPLILRQSTIPRTASRTYYTLHDGQTAVRVRVFQGDNPHCDDNVPVGQVVLPLRPEPAGAGVEVEFSYNLNGTVEVVARDPRTRSEVRAVMQPGPTRMSDTEKDRARSRLEQRWAERPNVPRPVAQRVEAQAAADWRAMPLYRGVAALVAHAEKRLSTLPLDPRTRVQAMLSRLKAGVEGADEAAVTDIERQLTDLLFDLE